MLNAKKKRQKTRKQARDDRAEKWCSVPSENGGCHGYYYCRRCPKCHPQDTSR